MIYLQCDSEDKDSEDNCSIWPVPKNLDLKKTNEQMYLGDNTQSSHLISHLCRSWIKSNLAIILQCGVTEQIPNTKEKEQAMEDSK